VPLVSVSSLRMDETDALSSFHFLATDRPAVVSLVSRVFFATQGVGGVIRRPLKAENGAISLATITCQPLPSTRVTDPCRYDLLPIYEDIFESYAMIFLGVIGAEVRTLYWMTKQLLTTGQDTHVGAIIQAA
jgi:hypothetical protein